MSEKRAAPTSFEHSNSRRRLFKRAAGAALGVAGIGLGLYALKPGSVTEPLGDTPTPKESYNGLPLAESVRFLSSELDANIDLPSLDQYPVEKQMAFAGHAYNVFAKTVKRSPYQPDYLLAVTTLGREADMKRVIMEENRAILGKPSQEISGSIAAGKVYKDTVTGQLRIMINKVTHFFA